MCVVRFCSSLMKRVAFKNMENGIVCLDHFPFVPCTIFCLMKYRQVYVGLC
jgi:hypothetical protein